MCEHIANYQHQNLWVDDRDSLDQGVIIRTHTGEYVANPPGLLQGSFAANVTAFNVPVSVTHEDVR